MVKFCTRCVISDRRPITSIEAKHVHGEIKNTTRFTDGVCDACLWANDKETVINWKDREKELQDLCDRYRKTDGSYDVIVPASGGKDSMYVSHMLKYKYNMNPLTVTWAPNIWTETGIINHQNLIKSGFDNILHSVNGKVHRLLTKLAFINLGHPFQPFIFGQRTVGPKEALKNNVSLVFYGENVAEYGNRKEDNYSPIMKQELYTCYDLDNLDTILGGVRVGDLLDEYGLTKNDLRNYNSPKPELCNKNGLQVHYMSYYRKWIPQENYYYAMKNTAFEPSPTRTTGSYSKYSGLDDKLEWLHYYMMFIKFGMGRATADASQEIRTGKITREEAVELVRLYDSEFPQQFLPDYLDYMNISNDLFFETIDKYRDRDLWEETGNGWNLLYQVT